MMNPLIINARKGIQNQYMKSIAAWELEEKVAHMNAAVLCEDFVTQAENAAQEHECTCLPNSPEACAVCKAQNRPIPY